jgi:hypothetical protein
MRPRALPVLLALAAATLACSDPAAPRSGTVVPDGPKLITNGTPTGTAYGSVGALLIDIGGDGSINGACTGGLIAPTVFLTAGHCVEFPADAVYYVSFAPVVVPIPPLTEMIRAEATYAHPDYAFPDNDLGVVILPAGSTTGIPLLTLPTLGYLDAVLAQGGLGRSSVVVAGYGIASLGRGWRTTGFDGVRRVGASKLLSLKPDILTYAKNALNAGRSGTCSGDSGSPVFLEGQDPSLVVVVHSFGNAPGCHSIGGGTRLDTEAARAFLDAYVTLP